MAAEVASEPAATATDLPPLSASDFQAYNRISVHMDAYHNHFRHEWRTLWDACSESPQSEPPSARALINTGLSFLSHLGMHHDIEETYFFPILARRMPEFSPGAAHLQQHKQIHKGMDELQEYLQQCREGSRDFRRVQVRECMQTWGDVLWTHLDEEVQTLRAQNMRRYWTLKEMRSLPI